MTQGHGSFLGSSVALAHIAPEASRGYILPGVTTSPTSGHYMVDRQLIYITTTVLARVIVPLEDVATSKWQLTKGNPDILP